MYFTRSPGDRNIFHQDLLHPDAKSGSPSTHKRLFVPLRSHGKTMRVITGLHSTPNQLCVWEDRNYSYRVLPEVKGKDSGGEITSLIRNQDMHLLATTENNVMHLLRENEHTYRYETMATHQLPFHALQVGLGETAALFTCQDQLGGVNKVNLETLQIDTCKLPGPVDSLLHVNRDRFLLGMYDGSTILLDPRLDKPVTMLSPKRDSQRYPPHLPLSCANRELFAITNTSTGRIELISHTKPTVKATLPGTSTSIFSLAASGNFLLVGDGFGANLWDSRMSKEPVSTLRTGFICHNAYLDSCKLIVSSDYNDFAVSDYLGTHARMFQSSFSLRHMDVSPSETSMIFSSSFSHEQGDTLAVLYPKLDRNDKIASVKTRVSSPTPSQVSNYNQTEQQHRLALQLASKRRLQAQRDQRDQDRKLQRNLTKLRAEERWNRPRE
ncbi:hypothetical protein BASA81_003503 [Batrachochytrium salamandrivorans]|nr:hypothetical protein BASA81_003503 [Batrachochytrium salamandrivorans]